MVDFNKGKGLPNMLLKDVTKRKGPIPKIMVMLGMVVLLLLGVPSTRGTMLVNV